MKPTVFNRGEMLITTDKRVIADFVDELEQRLKRSTTSANWPLKSAEIRLWSYNG